MSFSLSATNPITAYLAIAKNESAQVAAMVKSDSTIQRTEAQFKGDIVNISSATDILASHNLPALQVVLGAYNMSSQSTQTGLLKQLLVQDPTASGSLVQQTGSTNYLHFVRAMSSRTTVSLGFGDNAGQVFSTAGASASSATFHNLAWGTANSGLTAALPATAWTYVLNDGSAAASIANALTGALQSTSTNASPITGSYAVDASGQIVASGGAPAFTSSTDKAGNTTYALTLGTNSHGIAVRTAQIVSINAAATVAANQGSAITAAQGSSLLISALKTTGFDVATTGQAGLSITNPSSNAPLSLALNSFSDYAAQTTQPVSIYDKALFLGSAGTALKPGQTLLSQGHVIGTIQSVNSAGTVTLVAKSLINLAQGARVDVAIGAGLSNIGVQLTSPVDAGIQANTLALGPQALGIQPGQIVTDGSSIVGIVKAVDASGKLTFTANLAAPIAAGDTLGVLPQVTTATTPALSIASNAQSILSLYETNTYEAKEGKQVPGLNDALYFARAMPGVTSINQLMSDKTLLKVVTTNLGLGDVFNNLDFDQQTRLITAKVKLSDYSNPAKLQHASEQYLILTNEQAEASKVNTAIQNMFGDNPNSDGGGPDLLSTIFPSDSTDGGSGLLSLFSDTGDNTQNNGPSLL